MFYVCPVCAYPELPEPPQNFSICPSCGTEFGFDDAKMSYAELRQQWIMADAPWFSTVRHHSPDWNPWMQLITGSLAYSLPFTPEIHVNDPPVVEGMECKTREPIAVFS